MKRTEHTQKWLDALRSGEYEQGRNYLFSGGAYCCLGVAGKLAGIDIGESDNVQGAYGNIREAYGISDEEQSDLTIYNDDVRKTFPEIADEIEKMLDAPI